MAVGSSPRARGTLTVVAIGRLLDRFIPASAGNTITMSSSSGGIMVHPRERGEHFFTKRPVFFERGSSPRARGTRYSHDPVIAIIRFIPASAGNTYNCCYRSVFDTVHPRERGEHNIRRKHGAISSGSSPRARGTLSLLASGTSLMRFIPACAGNT